MGTTMNIYNELQVLRAKRAVLSAKLLNMCIQAADLPETSKERNMLRAYYKIGRTEMLRYDERIAALVKEVSCEI